MKGSRSRTACEPPGPAEPCLPRWVSLCVSTQQVQSGLAESWPHHCSAPNSQSKSHRSCLKGFRRITGHCCPGPRHLPEGAVLRCCQLEALCNICQPHQNRCMVRRSLYRSQPTLHRMHYTSSVPTRTMNQSALAAREEKKDPQSELFTVLQALQASCSSACAAFQATRLLLAGCNCKPAVASAVIFDTPACKLPPLMMSCSWISIQCSWAGPGKLCRQAHTKCQSNVWSWQPVQVMLRRAVPGRPTCRGCLSSCSDAPWLAVCCCCLLRACSTEQDQYVAAAQWVNVFWCQT